MRLTNKWLYTKYDAYDRPIQTGFYSNPTQTPEQLQTIFDNCTTYSCFANLPTTPAEILTTTTYDPAGFIGQIATIIEKILLPLPNNIYTAPA